MSHHHHHQHCSCCGSHHCGCQACHGHSHEDTCGHECHQESCHDHHEHGSFAHQLLEIADEAWMEIVKDKIKEQILASKGKHLEELAKLVATSNEERWKTKLAGGRTVEDFESKVAEFFHKK